MPQGLSILIMRAEGDTSDPVAFDEADPPFRRAVGEMGHVDVVGELAYAAERHRAQFAELGEDRLVQEQLLARIRGHFRRHPAVIRLAAGERFDVVAQCVLASRHGHRSARARLRLAGTRGLDRKSTRLNSSHLGISYAVFCLKKKKKK